MERVWRDYAEAVHWYRKAARQGYGKAQFNLAYMLRHGKGVEKDLAEADRLQARSGFPAQFAPRTA
jgi:TPR repeat protein